MRKFIVAILTTGLVIGCGREPVEINECSTGAIIKNFKGTDGCGYLFQLNDGTLLEPAAYTNPKETFPLVDGKRVYISYETVDAVSVCMMGQTVKITCLQEAAPIPDCIQAEIEKIKKESPRGPLGAVYRYTYQNKKVYFIPQYCCDFFSVLLTENCEFICAPDGGIMGHGDRTCEDFLSTRTHEELIWKDDRKGAQ